MGYSIVAVGESILCIMSGCFCADRIAEIDECFSDDKIEDILKIVSSEIPPSSPPDDENTVDSNHL